MYFVSHFFGVADVINNKCDAIKQLYSHCDSTK